MTPKHLECRICGHAKASHKWAFTNKHGTVYRYRKCRKCKQDKRDGITNRECPCFSPWSSLAKASKE